MLNNSFGNINYELCKLLYFITDILLLINNSILNVHNNKQIHNPIQYVYTNSINDHGPNYITNIHNNVDNQNNQNNQNNEDNENNEELTKPIRESDIILDKVEDDSFEQINKMNEILPAFTTKDIIDIQTERKDSVIINDINKNNTQTKITNLKKIIKKRKKRNGKY